MMSVTRRSFLAAVAAILFLPAYIHAEEKVTLATPITVPAKAEFTIDKLILDFKGQGVIVVVSYPGAANQKEYAWNGDEAITMMRALNKADLRTNTLRQRIYAQLAKSFPETAGTVTGTPD